MGYAGWDCCGAVTTLGCCFSLHAPLFTDPEVEKRRSGKAYGAAQPEACSPRRI